MEELVPEQAEDETSKAVAQPIAGEEQGHSNVLQQMQNDQWGVGQVHAQGQMFAAGFGFHGGGNGFPNMSGFAQGDINQFMQFMPNGMQNTGMEGFPNMMGRSSEQRAMHVSHK